MARLNAVLARPILAIGTPLSLIAVLAFLPLAIPILLPLIFLVLLLLLVAVLMSLMLVLLALLVVLVKHTPQLLSAPTPAPLLSTSTSNTLEGDRIQDPSTSASASASGSGYLLQDSGRGRMGRSREVGSGSEHKRLGSCHETSTVGGDADRRGMGMDDNNSDRLTITNTSIRALDDLPPTVFGIDSPRKKR